MAGIRGSISTAGRNAIVEGMEASAAQWVMTADSAAEAVVSGTSTMGNYGS